MSQLSSPAMVTHTCMHTRHGKDEPLLIVLPGVII